VVERANDLENKLAHLLPMETASIALLQCLEQGLLHLLEYQVDVLVVLENVQQADDVGVALQLAESRDFSLGHCLVLPWSRMRIGFTSPPFCLNFLMATASPVVLLLPLITTPYVLPVSPSVLPLSDEFADSVFFHVLIKLNKYLYIPL